MKYVITYLFLIAITYQTIGQLTVMAYFQMHQKQIADTRCENKAKPQLKCAGKCYLTKKLKALEEKPEAPKTSKEQKIEMLVYCVVDAFSLPSQVIKEDTETSFTYIAAIPTSYLNDVFHPPALLMNS